MSSRTIIERLNTALMLLVLLLLAAVGVVFWVQDYRTAANLRREQLSCTRDRIRYDILVMSEAPRARTAEPKNEAEGFGRAEADLRETLRTAEAANRDFPDLVGSLNALDEFALGSGPGTLSSFQSRAPDRSDSGSFDGRATVGTNYQELSRQRDPLFRDLSGQVTAANNVLSLKAQRALIVGWIGILVIVLAFIVIGRRQFRAVSEPLKRLVSTVEVIREGDLTRRAVVDRADELGTVSQGLNGLADDVCALVGQIQRSGAQVHQGASQIAARAQDQQTRIREIASALEQVSVASRQTCATSKALVNAIDEANQAAEHTSAVTAGGQTTVLRMEKTVQGVMGASGSVSANLAALSEKTANINSVVGTITKVADQTNLLSLNAAIEAEKAGEYGLGFAVVAVEIRRLADQTAVATYDIEKMVKEMQAAVSAGVREIDKFSEELKRGAAEVDAVGAHLAQVMQQVQLLTPHFQVINENARTQLADVLQISDRLAQLNQTVQRTAESLGKSSEAVEQLNATTAGLQTSVARFKLNNTPPLQPKTSGSGTGI